MDECEGSIFPRVASAGTLSNPPLQFARLDLMTGPASPAICLIVSEFICNEGFRQHEPGRLLICITWQSLQVRTGTSNQGQHARSTLRDGRGASVGGLGVCWSTVQTETRRKSWHHTGGPAVACILLPANITITTLGR